MALQDGRVVRLQVLPFLPPKLLNSLIIYNYIQSKSVTYVTTITRECYSTSNEMDNTGAAAIVLGILFIIIVIIVIVAAAARSYGGGKGGKYGNGYNNGGNLNGNTGAAPPLSGQ
jgi:hypothetical protein